MPEPKRPLKVFLCHASADKPAVRNLHRYLIQRGVSPWLDELNLLAGENWRIQIQEAIFASDVIVVCLSRNSINKEGYVQSEITFALDKAMEKPEGTIFIIPARLEDCEVPARLRQYHWVDLFQEGGHNRLMMSLNKRAAQLGPEILWGNVTAEPQNDLGRPQVSQQLPNTEKRTSKQRGNRRLFSKLNGRWLQISIIFIMLAIFAILRIGFSVMQYASPMVKASFVNNWIGIHARSSSSCAICHSTIPGQTEYIEWMKDGHSKVFRNPYFGTMYLGIDTRGNASRQTDPGYRLDYPENFGNCAYCHAPAAVKDLRQDVDLTDLILSRGDISVEAEGITCDVCHKVTGVLLGNDKLPYADLPGIQSMSFVQPASDELLVVGPLDAPTRVEGVKTTCERVFAKSEFCAACHYGKFYDVEIYSSYKEWLDSPYSNPENANYRTCQDCHMTGEAKIGNTSPSQRQACSAKNVRFHDFNHNMMLYGPDPDNPAREIPWMVKNAASMDVEAKIQEGGIKVTVIVTNTNAGHKFPTDSPLRHLILLIEVRDKEGHILQRKKGPTIPLFTGVSILLKDEKDYAGFPGEIYANVLKDKDTKLMPTVAYWNPVEPAWPSSDTRLVPGVPVQSEYLFDLPPNGSAVVTVTLIYRKAFLDIANQKGWPLRDLDVEVAKQQVEVR